MELFDRYALLDSAVHRLDARAKLLGLLPAVLAVVLTPRGEFVAFALFGVITLGLALSTRIPLGWLLSRALPVIPLVLFSVALAFFARPLSSEDTIILWSRWQVSAAALTWAASASLVSLLVVELTMIVIATSSVVGFLAALRRLGMPPLLVTTMQFALRYLVTIGEEAHRMMRARDVRGRPRRIVSRARVAGAIIGTLFVRSSARAMRVAHAMAARGFTGELPTLRPCPLPASHLVVCLLGAGLFWVVASVATWGVI